MRAFKEGAFERMNKQVNLKVYALKALIFEGFMLK